jgi:tRNA U34 5-carboxymethylaminomethyl modifying GTPase MnmE/TrmE
MMHLTLPDFGALAAKAPVAIRRAFNGWKAAKAEAARADEMAKAEAARAHSVAMAEAEAALSVRVDAVFAPLFEALARLEAKLDAILVKLG